MLMEAAILRGSFPRLEPAEHRAEQSGGVRQRWTNLVNPKLRLTLDA